MNKPTKEELKADDALFDQAINEGNAAALCTVLRNTFNRENAGHVNITLVENFKKLPIADQMEFVLLSSLRAGANLNQINTFLAALIPVPISADVVPPDHQKH
jgi:hypothetical protein